VIGLPSTKDAGLDFALQSPRLLTEDLPKHFRLEIAKSSALGPYREACKSLAQEELRQIHRDIALVSAENRILEKVTHHTTTHYPDARFPQRMWDKMEVIYGVGCFKDKDFYEDTLKHHPGLRIRIKYGVKGQELLRK